MNNNRDNYFFMEQVGPKNMIFTQKGQKTGKKQENMIRGPKTGKTGKTWLVWTLNDGLQMICHRKAVCTESYSNTELHRVAQPLKYKQWIRKTKNANSKKTILQAAHNSFTIFL